MAEWFTKDHAGREGIRSKSNPAWDWSRRTKTLRRGGPSDFIQEKLRELTLRLGPAPADLELYGEFDERDESRPPAEVTRQGVPDSDEEALSLALAARAEVQTITPADVGDLEGLGPL